MESKFTSIYRAFYRTIVKSNFHYAHRAVAISAVGNDYQLEECHIKEAISMNPTLAGIGGDFWKQAHETFTNHGLPTVSFLRIVTQNPAVLRRTPQRIIQSLEQWRGCQFGEKNVHLLITKYPEMLNVDDTQRMHKHITFLRSQVYTHKNVWKLLMNSPDLIEQTEQMVKDKMDYLMQVMRLDVPEIVKSSALSKSLLEIRTRHVFQERLGIFIPRKLKTNELQKSTNDRLYKITDTSEKTFATKICHATLDEYESFKILYERELKKTNDLGNSFYTESDISDKSEDNSDDETCLK